MKPNPLPPLLLLVALTWGAGATPPDHTYTKSATFHFLRMSAPPLARVASSMSPAEQRAYTRRLATAQEPLKQALQLLGVPIVATFQRVLNGIQVRGDAPRHLLAALPGVVAVHPVLHLRPELSHTAPHIGASQVATALGLDGTGITMGIIDSGIDYLHVAFGGPGTAEAYLANDRLVIDDDHEGAPLFPTARIVGGYDFVGADYDSSHGDLPTPDPDPMPDPELDELPDVVYADHGSHVAGIAGSGGGGEVAPGVAPASLLYSLKVFSQGSTSVTSVALEWAADPNQDGDLADRLDVVNLSIGSPYSGGGYDDEQSAERLAIEGFVAAGGVAVCSAGNSRNIPLVVSAPGAFAACIAVANAYGPGEVATRVEVTSPPSLAGLYAARAASQNLAPSLDDTGPVKGELRFVDQGCELESYPADMAGRVALTNRGGCKFGAKFQMAQEAGATALLVIHNKAGNPTKMSGSPKAEIPGLMVGQADGKKLAAALEGGEVVTVRLGADYPVPILIDTIRGASSRGPGFPERDPTTRRVLMKPNVTAPGAHVHSVAAGTGDQSASKSGTSMAAPHVAGVAALLRQARPDWTPREVRSAIMTTALSDVYQGQNPNRGGTGPTVPLSRQGAGRVDALAAVSTDVLAFGADPDNTTVALSFGLVVATGAQSHNQTLTLVNKGEAPATLSLSTGLRSWMHEDAGVVYGLSHDELVVAPGATAEVTVTLSIDPAGLNAWLLRNRSPDEARTGDGDALEKVEYDGWVYITGGVVPLRVPIYALIRPSAQVSFDAQCLPPGPFPLSFANSAATVGTVDLYTVVAEDSEDPGQDGTADIVAIAARTRDTDDGEVTQFAVVTRDWRAHPMQTMVAIYVDANRDSIADRVLVTFEEGYLDSGDPNGRVVTLVLDPSGSGFGFALGQFGPIDDSYVLTDLFSRVMTLSVPTEQLGTDPEDPAFDFWVAVFDRSGSIDGPQNVDDTSPDDLIAFQLLVSKKVHSFDPGCGQWRFEDMALVVDGQASTPVATHPSCHPAMLADPPRVPTLLAVTNNAPGADEALFLRAPKAEGLALVCEESITLEVTEAACEAPLDLAALVTSAPCPGTLAFDSSAPDALPAGTHNIGFAVTDGWGHGATCSVKVTVADTSPPSVGCGPGAYTMGADDGGDEPAELIIDLPASDPCGVTLTLDDASCGGCTAELTPDGQLRLSGIPVGTASISWTLSAADASGNARVAECIATVSWPDPLPAPPAEEDADGEGCSTGRSTGPPSPAPVALVGLLLLVLALRRTRISP